MLILTASVTDLEAVAQRCSVKKVFLKNFDKLTGKQLCESNFIKKETLVQVFSCEFIETFKIIFFLKNLRPLLLPFH